MPSLRHRWNRAFASIFGLALLGAAASTAVVTHLVSDTRASAEEVQEETTLVAQLRQALRTEDGLAHAFVDQPQANGRLFTVADGAVASTLTRAEAGFDDPAERVVLAELRTQWNTAFGFLRPGAQGLPTDVPLGGQRVETIPLHGQLGDSAKTIYAALERLEETALQPIAGHLKSGKQAERRTLLVLYALVALALAVTVHYARRVRKDVLEPIAKFRDATGTVGSGNLEHRVELDRDDEFGELAATFNAMAEAIDEQQRQLTEELSGRARLAAIVEASDQSIVGMSPDLVVTSWNPGAERIYGYTAEEAIGRNIFELLLPEHRDPKNSALHRVARGARISGHEVEVRNKAGEVIPISVAASPIFENGTIVGLSTIGEDISKRKALEERLHHQAFHDPLTGLANRALIKDRLDHALARQARNGGTLGVVLLDLDDFKAINDSLGHCAGDELLMSVADRLRACTREADTLARLGGDEFAILMEDLDSPEDATALAERIVTTMGSRFAFEGQSFPVSASVGIAIASGGDASLDDVIRDADVAMYLTKNAAKGSYTVFQAGMHLAVKERLRLKADLARALGTDELSLHYQPIIDLPTGDIVGVEALARWTHPELGPVPPAEFIPVAEESSLIIPLGLWVLETACRDVQGWQESGEASQPLRLSVNISGRQLEDPGFVESVRRLLEHLAFDPTQLVFEITETVLVTKAEQSIDKLHQLKALGVQLAIDDFGTGYSSLSSLQRLPVDIVKVDRSFISHLDGDGEQAELARAVLGIGRTLQLQTVAEGVESDHQATELRRLECRLAQGYYFARPTDGVTLSRLLRNHAFNLPAPA